MTDRFGLFFGGFMTGVSALVLLLLVLTGFLVGDLEKARDKYTACIELGAPERNCLEKYLLPHTDGE